MQTRAPSGQKPMQGIGISFPRYSFAEKLTSPGGCGGVHTMDRGDRLTSRVRRHARHAVSEQPAFLNTCRGMDSSECHKDAYEPP